MIPQTLVFALFVAAAASETLKPVTPPTPLHDLSKRQVFGCGVAEEECGIGCIPLTWTCCPGGSGGCGILETCVMGTNDEYGCCRVGRRCVGEGGVTAIGGDRGGGPVPTRTDDGNLIPVPTSTGGSSLGGSGDDDDLDFGDDDDESSTTTTSVTAARPAPTFPRGDDVDTEEGSSDGSGAVRNALSLAGAAVAALLAL